MNKLTSQNGRATFTMHNTGRVSISHDDVMVATGLLVWSQTRKRYVLMDRIAPKPTPPAPNPGSGLLTGQLTCDGRVFSDDTGPRVPIMCHAGDLLWQALNGQMARVHQAFRDLVQYGYAGLRSWSTINTADIPLQPGDLWYGVTLGPRTTPRYFARCEEVIKIGSEQYGLVWHVAPGDLFRTSDREDNTLFDGWADIIQRHPTRFALAEGCNELLHTSDQRKHTTAYVDALVQRIRDAAPSVLCTWSAAAGDASEEQLPFWTPPWAKHWYVHDFRGPWFQAMGHNFTLGYQQGLGWGGEPPGMNWGSHQLVSGMPQRQQHGWPRGWTLGRYALYGALMALSRKVPCFMSSYGVKLEGPLTDAPGFKEWPALICKLPTRIHGFQQLFHGGDAFRGIRILAATPHSRVEHAIDSNGDACMVAYGEDGTHQLPVERAWDGLAVFPDGREETVKLRRGETYRVTVGDGVLLVGTLV